MKYLMVGLLVLGMAFPSITQAQTVDPIQSQIDALIAQVTELQKLLALIQQVEALQARLDAVEGKQDRDEEEGPVLGGGDNIPDEPAPAPVVRKHVAVDSRNSVIPAGSTRTLVKVGINPQGSDHKLYTRDVKFSITDGNGVRLSPDITSITLNNESFNGGAWVEEGGNDAVAISITLPTNTSTGTYTYTLDIEGLPSDLTTELPYTGTFTVE